MALAVLITLTFLAAPAAAESFTFETTPIGVYSPLSVTDGSLTLTITTEGNPNGFIFVRDSEVPLLGSRSVIGSDTNPFRQFAPLRFTFSSPVDQITFAFGDAGGDNDSPVIIQAFNASNVLLGTLTDTYVGGVSTGKTISGSFSAASYFILRSGTPETVPNSIFWEVPSVTRSQQTPIPEPATVILLSTGLAGVGAANRRRRRAAE